MSAVETIKNPIKAEMEAFEKHFKQSMKSTVPLLTIITNYILRRKGKQMRPMFVFLTAKMLGTINNSTYTAASLVELLHTATLIHDDVVDESYQRRGFFSINALWKSKIAVLMGDYLLAKGLLLSVDNNEFDLLRIVSNAVKEMSEGELLQIQKSRKLNLTREQYFDIIRKKTATLIAACTACGARSIEDNEEHISKMSTFGTYVGMAFQIKDDLFDYEPKSVTGKPSGNDIKEKKFTLPLIYALEEAPKKEKKRIVSIVKNGKATRKSVAEVIAFTQKYRGLDFAKETMNDYAKKAKLILQDFPDNEARTSLIALVDYTINRKK